ncbi:arsenic resistance protein [Verticiella sediminum]|uniref:Arsenic resistance protein n=1 Tax=Verticiella sediminum TaxID=1247510 RepID=A0A556ACB5_9BURK|nr:arsenic resistance protein [Verticiella sediminum]TSH90520.1 arsenic resistance protein [Verticiella sediminum]
MSRLALERYQVWVYLLAILVGLAVGSTWPGSGPALERGLWPTLALLLYATFLQMPLLHVRAAMRDRRFTAAMLLGNFVAIPLVVWALVESFAFDPVTRLGVLLVLLMPCTDWFITFSQLGKGDALRAVVSTPLNLVLQLLLLPFYLWLMADAQVLAGWEPATLLPAVFVVLAPLVAAAATEKLVERYPGAAPLKDGAAWAPVPLLGLTVFLIAAAHAGAVAGALAALLAVVPIFVLFLLFAALLAKGLAAGFRLPAVQGRTLAFSFATRNSFVVLPLALSLPAGAEAAALVIVTQSLVELFGMVVYVVAIPRRLFPETPFCASAAGRRAGP